MSLNELLLSPETMKAHSVRWFAYSGPYGEKEPLRKGQKLIGIGYDVTCKCGWESKTGGAIKASVQRDLLAHRLDEQAKASARQLRCRRCDAGPGEQCHDGTFSRRLLPYLHPERWEDDLAKVAEQ